MARSAIVVLAAIVAAIALSAAHGHAVDRAEAYGAVDFAAGWAALLICSGVFVAGLPLEVLIAEDCGPECETVDVQVDYAERSVTAVPLAGGAAAVKSIWRGDGVGCTVVDGLTEAELRAQDVGDQSPLPALNATTPWPLGDLVDLSDLPADVDFDTVDAVVDADFACDSCNTRAVVTAHRGRVVVERYAPGITERTRLLGWSATKSATNALVGILVGEGRLNLSAPAPVAEWQADPDDPRGAVTLSHLMQMASGVLWDETPDGTVCLITEGAGDCAGWFARRPAEDPPGTRFEYSTGTTMVLSRIVMEQRGDPAWNDFEWCRQKLFRPLSMVSAVIEPQANGVPGGGSLGYMTARDWVRLGLLYLRDGVWVDGTRILPEGWVDYSRTGAPTSRLYYGAQFWLGSNPVPFYYMSGYRDQQVWIVPSKDLVVARFSMPPVAGSDWNAASFLQPIITAFPDAR